ncbi:MAG: CbiX/SirB N-terminal domain-containing protein, partial [Pseudomonadota bacterium]
MTTSCTISQLPASGSNRWRQTAVLVGHGERGGARTNALLLGLADTASNPDIQVFGGVLNGSPSFEDAIHAARAASDAPVLVYPFFMSPGYFVNTVLPRRIKDIGLTDDCRILRPFGSDPSLIDVMHRHAIKSATKADLTPANSRLLLVGHGSRSGAPASAISTRQAASALAQRNAFHCV